MYDNLQEIEQVGGMGRLSMSLFLDTGLGAEESGILQQGDTLVK